MEKDMKTKIIAEIGVNHNGNMSLAIEMIDSAKKAGADVVKFQTYISEELMLEDTPLAEYMTATNAKNFMEIAKSNELSPKETLEIKEYCKKIDIDFMSSPFDPISFVDLGNIARDYDVPHHGLRGLVAMFLKHRISKGAQISDWSKTVLSQSQITYAATDAWISLKLFEAFEQNNWKNNE